MSGPFPLLMQPPPHAHHTLTMRPCALKTPFTEIFPLESGLAMLISSIIFPKKVEPPLRQTIQVAWPTSRQKQITPCTSQLALSAGFSSGLRHPGLSQQGPDAWPVLILGTPYPTLSCSLWPHPASGPYTPQAG